MRRGTIEIGIGGTTLGKISFEPGARSRLWAGFAVKLGVRIYRRDLGGEAWNRAGTKGCSALDPTRGRSKEGEWDMRHILHPRKVDFSIRIIL